MTDDTHTDDSSHRTTDDSGGVRRVAGETDDRSIGTSRRTFLRAAGVSAGALAVGTPVVSADGHDGDLAQLYVEGNRIVDADGNEVPLRGVTITDPKGLDLTAPARGKNASQVLDLVTDAERGWHPTLIRIVVRPQHIGEFALEDMDDAGAPPAFEQEQVESYAEEFLDPVIDQLADAGVYAIVDFQREDSLGEFDWTEDPIGTEIERFWEVVAPRYAERNHVLYELYGIPTEPGVWGDPTEKDWWADPWYQWKETAQPWVDLIREHAPETIVIVGTPGYNQSPEGVLVEEFDGANLAYAYHNYPGFPVSDEQDWDGVGPDGGGTMGAAEEVPLFVTEFGWRAESVESDSPVETFEGSTSGYGEPFVEWMESQPGLYWTAAAADPAWFTPTFSAPFSDLSRDELRQLDPYGGDVPQACADLPCEWPLLGEDEGDYDTYMGAFVKDTLADLQSDVDLSGPSGSRPSPVATVAIDARSSSSVTVSWPAADGADHYELSVDGTNERTVDGTEATVTDLTPGTSYQIGVAVVDGDGVASATTTSTVETTGTAPEPPEEPHTVTLALPSDGVLSATWSAVDDADSYAVYLDGELVEETTATETTFPDVDLTTETVVGVSAVDSVGESSRAVATWTPFSERDVGVRISTSEGVVEQGETVDVEISLSEVPATLTDFEFTLAVEGDGQPEPPALVADVTSDAGFETVSTDDVDGGTASVEVSLENGAVQATSERPTLATATLVGARPGHGNVDVRDPRAQFEPVDESVAVHQRRTTVHVPTDAPPSPALIDVEERTASSIELSWLPVDQAGEYAVYATEYGVTDESVDEVSPLEPPTEDALVARTTDESATIGGLEPLESYEVAVTAVSEQGTASPPATQPVTTTAESDATAPEIGVELAADLIEESDATTAEIVLSDPPADLAGYVVEVRVADPSIASVGDVTFGSAFDLTQVRARDDGGEWATFEGITGDGVATDGDAISLGSIAIEAGDPGTTDVAVTARPLTLASTESADVGTSSARLSVDVANWEGTMQSDGVVYEPNDASGDGLYRDVTGDGAVTNSDILVFFDNQHTDVVQNHADLFDFDRSGDVSQADVVKLFESVAGN